MRKILITLVLLIALVATVSMLWVFWGRQLSLFADRFGTIETGSSPVRSLIYEGSGTGGTFLVNELHLNLDPADPRQAPPHTGTTKDDQLALSFEGKVFPFGQSHTAAEAANETLTTSPQPDDEAKVSIRHSVVNWPEPFRFRGASWKRHVYYELVWKKSSGAQLRLVWRYEQAFYSDRGWVTAFMTREGSTSLIKIDIRL